MKLEQLNQEQRQTLNKYFFVRQNLRAELIHVGFNEIDKLMELSMDYGLYAALLLMDNKKLTDTVFEFFFSGQKVEHPLYRGQITYKTVSCNVGSIDFNTAFTYLSHKFIKVFNFPPRTRKVSDELIIFYLEVGEQEIGRIEKVK